MSQAFRSGTGKQTNVKHIMELCGSDEWQIDLHDG